MSALKNAFEKLVVDGLLTPAADNPIFGPWHERPAQRSRVVYNVGEALIRQEEARAKLEAGSRRNSNLRA